jgi:hypothetical protein
MCFKLDNGSELFSIQDMHRLRKKSSGVMGSRSWARSSSYASEPEIVGTVGPCSRDADALGDRAEKG